MALVSLNTISIFNVSAIIDHVSSSRYWEDDKSELSLHLDEFYMSHHFHVHVIIVHVVSFHLVWIKWQLRLSDNYKHKDYGNC